MYNEKERISASEVNKYCYCNYSWYYERLYGAKYIRQKYTERNEELGLYDKTTSNFKRGINFHDKYSLRRKIAFLIRILILLLVIICAILIFIRL